MFTATPAQRALLHAGESALRSAALTIGAGVYQYVVTNGLNIPGLLGFLGIAFVAQLAMIDKSIRSNPQLTQGELDTAKNLPAELKALPDALTSLHTKFDLLVDFLTRRMATPPTAIGQAAPSVQVSPLGVGNTNATATPVTFAAPAQVPQQLFPAPQFPPRFTANEMPVVQGQ